MEYYFQQDTVVVKAFTDSVQNVLESPVRDTSKLTTDTIVKPKPPTFAQIRYWRWQREKKMLIGDSRYIQPRNDVKLTTSTVINEKGIGLPVRSFTMVNTDWITIILLLALALFATMRTSYEKYLSHLFLSLVNYPTAYRMFQEKNYNIVHGAFRLEIFFYIVFSIFLFQLINIYQIGFYYTNFVLFILCFGSVITYFFVKKTIYLLLGSIFGAHSETREFLFNMDNFNRISGLFLFPIVSLIAFNPFKSADFTVSLGIFTFLVFYLILIQRGISILLKKQFPIYYLFLYLCSLEFLPLLLIYKVTVG